MFDIALHIYVSGYESKIRKILQGYQIIHCQMGVGAYGRESKGVQIKLDWENTLFVSWNTSILCGYSHHGDLLSFESEPAQS